jgi:hypothetical protein
MSEQYSQQQQTANTLAEIFLHQSTRMLQIQASAARALLRTHARTYAALGGPDWSPLFGAENERRFDDLLRTTTEQTLSLLRQTNQSVSELQQSINGLIARQADQFTSQLRGDIQQIGQKVEQSASEVRRTAQQASEALQQASLEGGRPRRS